MRNPPRDAEMARRALCRRQPLLAAWLDALNKCDDPMHRPVANFRDRSLLRREIDPIRGAHLRAVSSNLAEAAACQQPDYRAPEQDVYS